MKIIKIIASLLLILGIFVLIVWTGMEAKKQKCTGISIVIHAAKECEMLTKSDILNILKKNNIQWEGTLIEEIKQPDITKILEHEKYIKSVDNVHFLGSKLQIEISLHHILLEVHPNSGERFLVEVNGAHLPYSPKCGSDVIVATGFIAQKNGTASIENTDSDEIFYLASLIKNDPYYEDLFHKLEVTPKQEFILFPSFGTIPVLFGTTQNAENKFKTLKYMYKDVLPYVSDDKYAQLDVRFQNRIIATKTKS
jgi:cell division protein FtsQ